MMFQRSGEGEDYMPLNPSDGGDLPTAPPDKSDGAMALLTRLVEEGGVNRREMVMLLVFLLLATGDKRDNDLLMLMGLLFSDGG